MILTSNVIRPFNCGMLSITFLNLLTVALAPSELVGVAETARARLIRTLPARHWIALTG